MVGLAFQIADDILDITGKQEEIGKDVGSDLKKGKKTFPSFYGLEESRTQGQRGRGQGGSRRSRTSTARPTRSGNWRSILCRE